MPPPPRAMRPEFLASSDAAPAQRNLLEGSLNVELNVSRGVGVQVELELMASLRLTSVTFRLTARNICVILTPFKQNVNS